jgi:hypothetical protein
MATTKEPIPITPEQLDTMIAITKDAKYRLAANGMPELDEDLQEMIELMENASRKPPGEVIPERISEDPVKPIVDPARPPEGKVIPKDATLGDLESGKVKLEDREKKKPIVDDKEHKQATVKELEAEKKDRREEYASHQKPKHEEHKHHK